MSESSESQITVDDARDTPQILGRKLARQESKRSFEMMLIRLGVGGHSAAVQLFGGRVNYTQMVDWRRGRALIPQWAFDFLATMLRSRATADLELAELCRKPRKHSAVEPTPQQRKRPLNPRPSEV